MSLMCMLALAVVMGPVGCGDDDDDSSSGGSGGKGAEAGKGGSSGKGSTAGKGGSSDAGPDEEAGSGGKGGTAGKGGSTAGSGGTTEVDCPDIADRKEVEIDGTDEIDADTTWTCDNLYILTTDLVFVTKDSTLTIEAGTVIQGDPGTALIVTRGSKLITEGTAKAPVVFTSSNTEGNREAGDWGGVALLGSATLNVGKENRLEGIDPTDDRGLFGGTDDKSNCGSLAYTRIEFAGFELSIDNELNGLTLGGCGSDTSISYVQVHHGSDDGIEVFGGEPQLDHIVLTGNKDDGFDTDEGNHAKVQFLIIQQDPAEADSGFEWDNYVDDPDGSPRSMPTVYNATLIGTNDKSGMQRGMVLRRGTAGQIFNTIVQGFPVTGVDVRDPATVANTKTDPADLTIENSILFEDGADGMSFFADDEATDGSSTDNDMGFSEADFFEDASRNNVTGKDPKIADPYNLTAPDFVPAKDSPAADGAAKPPSDGFFKAAAYIGAIEPGGDDWTADWTAYPKN